MPILLTEAEARRVVGLSDEGLHALDPVPIKGGMFMLGEQVLDDPAHADVRDFLMARNRRAVERSERYVDGEEAAFEARLVTSNEKRSRDPDPVAPRNPGTGR